MSLYLGTKKISDIKLIEIETVGDATAEDILAGKTAWVNGKLITGTAKFENDEPAFGTRVSMDIGTLPNTITGEVIGDTNDALPRLSTINISKLPAAVINTVNVTASSHA